MPVNYALVFVAALAQFALGALWYSPILFGKQWMHIMGAEHLSKEELKKMQKDMAPFYALQLFLTFFTTVSFVNLLPYISGLGIYHVAFWIWIGFIAPLQIGGVIWGNTKKKVWLSQIAIEMSFQLVAIMVMAWIVSM